MRSTFKTVLVAMLAVFALSAVAASAAQAEEEPYFKVAGSRLAEGQSKEITAKATEVTIQIGEGDGLISKCSLTLASGAMLLGSNKNNPGRAEMIFEITNCTGGSKGCEGVGTNKSHLLLGTLVQSEKGKGKLEVLLKAKTGSVFMPFKLKETCPYGTESLLAGGLVAEVYSGGKPVEIGKEPAEAATLNLVFPEQNINHCWLIKEGKGEEVRNLGLSSALWGNVPITSGSLPLELTGGALWGVFD